MSQAQAEIEAGQRFAFGQNWQGFLRTLDEDRIVEAERSLATMLGTASLAGKTFIDVGCGSGLFSLAAMRLHAARVHSLDFDEQSVACAQELRRRFYPETRTWTIEEGSVLDRPHITTLGRWDVVYSWGVLHHTGHMWSALENVVSLVAEGGSLFISIYNDQGRKSDYWRTVKTLYNQGRVTRAVVQSIFIPYWILGGAVIDIASLRDPTRRYTEYRKQRGMSRMHDWTDWLGGLPFEVAAPEQVVDFFNRRDFVLAKLRTCGGGLGCNEFVFRARTPLVG